MNYDVKVHLGQQVENFLNGYAAGDKAILQRSITNISSIFEETGDASFKTAMEKMDKTRKDELQKIWNKAKDAMKLLADTKEGDAIFIDVEEIKQDVVDSLAKLETNYWDSIRGLLLRHTGFKDG